MYAIVNVMYGVPLNSNEWPSPVEWSAGFEEYIEEAQDEKDADGFYLPYSGAGDTRPGTFGICLGEFDEACHHVDISDLKLVPTAAQLKKYKNLWDKLPKEIRSEITVKYGDPRTHLLWSTS